ncbi:MAG TPA: hypothetical protein VFW73_04950 [Lacipirellulaceae bacterium]|nr:hypothetical protein [Lacipirellulaceae bacterium]
MGRTALKIVCRDSEQLLTYVFAAVVAIGLAAPAVAARPSAMKLFPEDTLVFVRVANAQEFGEKFSQTGMGRMIKDPKLKPFVDHFYGKVGDLYARHVEGKLGVSWDDLKKLPRGEAAFGVVARDQQPPAFLLLVDQGSETSVADKLLDKSLDIASKKGGEISKEKIGGVDVTVVRDHDKQNRMFGAFERENTIVVATDPNVLRNVLWHWDHAGAATPEAPKANDAASSTDNTSKNGDADFTPTRTLAENARFVTILRQCRRKQDPPPQLIFFADPIGLVRNIGAGDKPASRIIMGMLAPLGLDGIDGLGGALTYATDQYDGLAQLHILLENPRAGILQLPAFEQGDTSPQPFVPKEIETYFAWNFNLKTTYDRLSALVDRFGGKGDVDKFVKEKLSDKLGIDVVTQVIDNLKGRYTWMIGYDRPTRIRGQGHVLAFELKDEKLGQDALKTVVAKFPELFEEVHFGKASYYAIMPQKLKDQPEADRAANPFVAIMDGYLFVGTSRQQFERCISARDGTADRLIDSDDYVRTSAVIGRETGGMAPVVFTMNRPEESFHQWYDLLTTPELREKLGEVNVKGKKIRNPVFATLLEMVDAQQLPPFEVIAQYFAPGGGILYDTDSGYHGISFTLRNKAEP